jgi:hypothetical protein
MDKAWEWIKSHPYVAGGIFFVVGVIVVYMFFGGSSAPPVDNTAAAQAAAAAQEAASGNALQAAQQGYQAQTAQQGIAAGVQANTDASQVQIAQLQESFASSQATLEAQVATTLATLSAGTSDTQSTAAASVANNQTNASLIANLYDKIVAANPAVVGTINPSPGETYSGSYGQSVYGYIGTGANYTPFGVELMPNTSPLVPWGNYSSLQLVGGVAPPGYNPNTQAGATPPVPIHMSDPGPGLQEPTPLALTH